MDEQKAADRILRILPGMEADLDRLIYAVGTDFGAENPQTRVGILMAALSSVPEERLTYVAAVAVNRLIEMRQGDSGGV